MSHPSLGPESSALFETLETLYPLACVLTGPDEAETLLRRVFERAAQVPPIDRPDDHRAWLFRLLLEEQGDLALPSPSSDRVPDPTSESSHPFRQEVAEQILEGALPAAMAACTVQEQFLLALGVFGDADGAPDVLATALDTTPETAQQLYTDAGTALRANLHDVLTDREQWLVEETLSDEAFQEAVEALFEKRFPRIPPSIRADIRRTLQTTRSKRDEGPAEEPAPSNDSTSLSDRLPSVFQSYSLVGAVVALAVLVIVGLGIYYWTPPSSPASSPRPSLVAFSAQRTDSVQFKLKTNTHSEAEAYVQSTWNRRVTLPSIENAELQGVGQLRISGSLEVPVFLYADENDPRITIFAYSYALLDRIQGRASLEERLRSKLAQSKHLVTHRNAAHQGILWRDQDDIFVAVTSSIPVDSLDLRNWLQPED